MKKSKRSRRKPRRASESIINEEMFKIVDGKLVKTRKALLEGGKCCENNFCPECPFKNN